MEIDPEKVWIGSLGLDFHCDFVRKRSRFALKSCLELVLFWKILFILKILLHSRYDYGHIVVQDMVSIGIVLKRIKTADYQ